MDHSTSVNFLYVPLQLPAGLQVRNLRALQGAGGGRLRRPAARQGERDAPPLGRHQQQDRLGQVSHPRHNSRNHNAMHLHTFRSKNVSGI